MSGASGFAGARVWRAEPADLGAGTRVVLAAASRSEPALGSGSWLLSSAPCDARW